MHFPKFFGFYLPPSSYVLLVAKHQKMSIFTQNLRLSNPDVIDSFDSRFHRHTNRFRETMKGERHDMHRPELLQHCNGMVQNALAHGGTPIAFLMNGATRAILTQTVLHEEKLRRSAWARFWTWLRGEKFELTHLLGVPVVENPHLENGFISLQVAMEGTAPGLGGGQNAPAEQKNPFQRRERVEAPVGASENRAPMA